MSPCAGKAPAYSIPHQGIVTVEHPGVVRNVDKALESLGGQHELSCALGQVGHKEGPRLRLNSTDPFRTAIRSYELDASNVVLKVHVPRLTGRKRKRGSDGSFSQSQNVVGEELRENDAKKISKALYDNPGTYSFQIIGIVDKIHRFRALPDFQYSLGNSNLATSFRDKIMSYDYESIKKFALELRPKEPQPNTDIIPPPSIALADMPINYAYHEGEMRAQDQAMAAVNDSTPSTIFTRYRAQKSIIVGWEEELLPTGPPKHLVSEQALDRISKDLILELRSIMNERPIITRRVAFNKISKGSMADFKQVLPYVGYTFKSGPWRDALVQFGVDPRTDSKYAKFQTLGFQLRGSGDASKKRSNSVWETPHRDQDQERHVFDGKHLSTDGSIWQICDITDPYIRSILGTGAQSRCDAKFSGWYDGQTIAKVRAVMKDKITGIMSRKGSKTNKAVISNEDPPNTDPDQGVPSGLECEDEVNEDSRLETNAELHQEDSR